MKAFINIENRFDKLNIVEPGSWSQLPIELPCINYNRLQNNELGYI